MTTDEEAIPEQCEGGKWVRRSDAGLGVGGGGCGPPPPQQAAVPQGCAAGAEQPLPPQRDPDPLRPGSNQPISGGVKSQEPKPQHS